MQPKPELAFLAEPDADEIRRELGAVLSSAAFRTSKRCHDFLDYVVTEALRGDAEGVKERAIAVKVFGRKNDAPLGDDSIVRVGAREVRKRLAQYYVQEGANDRVRIDLPAGSYIPTFQFLPGELPARSAIAEAVPVAGSHLKQGLQPVEIKKTRRIWPLWLTVAAALLLATAAFAWRHSRGGGPAEFEAFWRPAFLQSNPILLAVAHPIVYHPSERLTKLDEQRNGPEVRQRAIQLGSEPLRASDFVPAFDQYVGFGDAVAANRLSILFAQRQKPIRLRMASKVDFADVRDSPTVLIGAFTNRWASELAQDLRYRFQIVEGKPMILDSVSEKSWTLTGKRDSGRADEDFILICRLIRAQTGGFAVIAAGLTQYGTEQAGRILSDPELLSQVLRRLPTDWRNRNIQLVLHSRVVGDAPITPELLASYAW